MDRCYSLEHGGGHSSCGGFVQRSWTSGDLADDPSINLLETRAAGESVMALSEPGDRVRLHIDNRTAAAYIRYQGVQKVMFFPRRLSFFGNRQCQEILLSCLLTGFPQRRTQLQTSCQDMIWTSGCSVWTEECSGPSWSTSAFSQLWMPLLAVIQPSSQDISLGTGTNGQ